MSIEYLANEILLYIFEYLDTHELLRTFHQLNCRFNHLLQSHFLSHRLNFASLSKDEYDYFCQHYLQFFLAKIPSICLSNGETPGLLAHFLSQGFTLDRFVHLKSLSLSHIHSVDTLNTIISQCQSLQFLTHLNIFDNYHNQISTQITNLLDNIWNLKHLISCQLNGIHCWDTNHLGDISRISSSIQYLSIEHILLDLASLSYLLRHTPSLRQFHGIIHSYSQTDQFDVDISSIKSLKLTFGGLYQSLEKLFKTCSNLTSLDIDISRVYFDGNQWEYLIINSLPKLKTFHLRMTFNLYSYSQSIDQILESFRSDFWIKEHQWFIYCLWNPSDPDKLIILYTLPSTFDYSNSADVIIPKKNISHLHLNLSRHDVSKMNLSMLRSLKILDLSIYRYSSYSQLQILFDQAPNLYSVKVLFAIGLIEYFFTLTSKSIQRLNFLDQMIYFSRSDCLRLINSPLSQQCQVLFITLRDRTSILDLIQQMNYLRSLVVDFEDDDIDLMQWLKRNLSSNDCILRDLTKVCRIQIWIDRQVKRTLSYRE